MTNNKDEDLKNRVENLESEIKENSQNLSARLNSSQQINQFKNWFNNLATMGKIVIIGGGLILAGFMIKIVFQLLSLLVSLAVLGVIAYVVYLFFIPGDSSKK